MTLTATPSPQPALDVDAGVIEEARARKRNRWRNIATCCVAAILVGFAVYRIANGGHTARSSLLARATGDLPSCKSHQLRASSAVGGLAGSLEISVEISNHSAHGCGLVGKPSVELYSADSGKPLREQSVKNPGLARLRPVPILAPGSSAGIIVWWGNWCGAMPRGGPTLVVYLAHADGTLTLRIGDAYAPCYGKSLLPHTFGIVPPGEWGRQINPVRIRPDST
jgi:hypothetical protein